MCMFFSVWGVSLAREAVLRFGDITNMAVPRFHVCHQGEKRKRTGLVLEFLFSLFFLLELSCDANTETCNKVFFQVSVCSMNTIEISLFALILHTLHTLPNSYYPPSQIHTLPAGFCWEWVGVCCFVCQMVWKRLVPSLWFWYAINRYELVRPVPWLKPSLKNT